MSASASIQKMSHKHEAILQFLISNPTMKMGDVAAVFDVTFSWLSTIVHSHAFQEQLASRHDELFDTAIVQEIGGKLEAAAHVTLDAYLDKVPTLTPDQLISAQDKILGRLGYGSKPGGGTIINGDVVQTLNVSPAILEEARNRIGANKVERPSGPASLSHSKAHEGIEIEGSIVRGGDSQEAVG